MTYHLDIRLRPDPDFPPQTLMNVLFSKLHRALASRGAGDIGVSFPGYEEGRRLDSRLRLHGSEDALTQLMGQAWLAGMLDHVLVSVVAPSPAGAFHRVVRRVQAKSSPDRIRRRQMRRHGLSEQEALEKIPDASRKTVSLPYLQIRSASTEQSFPLFIQHGPPLDKPRSGRFSSYGLSDTATIPWF